MKRLWPLLCVVLLGCAAAPTTNPCPGKSFLIAGMGCVADIDRDGLIEGQDRCPIYAEDIDGFEDEDGCPEFDNDLDTTLDDEDACPMRPGPYARQGCPPQDIDGDGLNNNQDRCPQQTEDIDGFEDDDGCPDPDNDGDGIPDEQDRCANLPASGNGCPKEGSPQLMATVFNETLLFKNLAVEPTKAHRRTLNTVAERLKNLQDTRQLLIGGFCQPDEPEPVGLLRATLAREALMDAGAPKERLHVINCCGIHKAQPLCQPPADNPQETRRVEFRLHAPPAVLPDVEP